MYGQVVIVRPCFQKKTPTQDLNSITYRWYIILVYFSAAYCHFYQGGEEVFLSGNLDGFTADYPLILSLNFCPEKHQKKMRTDNATTGSQLRSRGYNTAWYADIAFPFTPRDQEMDRDPVLGLGFAK